MRRLILGIVCLLVSLAVAGDVQDPSIVPSKADESVAQMIPAESPPAENTLAASAAAGAGLAKGVTAEGLAADGLAETDSTSDTIPYKRSELDLGDTISSSVLYLGILFGVAAVAVLLFKRRMVATGALPDKLGSHIRLIDRKVLSTRVTLHLLDIDGREVVVAESAQSPSILELSPATDSSTFTRSDDT